MQIESAIHGRLTGRHGEVIEVLQSRHAHTLDKYIVRVDESDETPVLWDIELKKLESNQS